MAETTTAPTNKYVAFKGRAQKEFTRAYKRGLISDSAVTDRYVNTYTLDTDYQPSRTSPLPRVTVDTRTPGKPRDIRTDAEKKRDKARQKAKTAAAAQPSRLGDVRAQLSDITTGFGRPPPVAPRLGDVRAQLSDITTGFGRPPPLTRDSAFAGPPPVAPRPTPLTADPAAI